MLKDNENVPLPMLTSDGPDSTPGLQPFARDQMVACDKCLRTNPPTRVNCLYCGALLPLNETTFNLQKPTLRRLEKWELGYNNLLVPPADPPGDLAESELAEAADVLKLSPADFASIISTAMPLPLARTATLEEASLVQRRLRDFGIETRIIADVELGVNEAGPMRVRAIELDEAGFRVIQTSESTSVRLDWSDLILIVVGRLISARVELKEQKTRAENRILDSSKFFSDEAVVEFYAKNQPGAFRVTANSFNFSSLGTRKGLLAGENMSTLLELFRERAPLAVVDESYKSLRKVLEPVWSTEQQNESGGWRRERPGKYSIGSVNEKNNETQFMRYSLLRRYLLLEARSGLK
ncbi:MAG TPA: hypothetical protein VEW46_09555 [Pyrinomonadaceae bacterium]|nr:hypothetical protein [Pyrinomonadaceae bacterium]